MHDFKVFPPQPMARLRGAAGEGPPPARLPVPARSRFEGREWDLGLIVGFILGVVCGVVGTYVSLLVAALR